MNNDVTIWNTPETDNLASALLSIENSMLMKSFLRDIMTEKELLELSNRFKAAQMLINSEKYTSVIQATGLSSRTVARISDWIKKGNGGYRQVIENLDIHHSHTLPARD